MLITGAEAARQIGVSKQAVSKAIAVGRLPVYDETGVPVAADHEGRKFVKADEARAKFKTSRARIDDHVVAEVSAELDGNQGQEATTPDGTSDDLFDGSGGGATLASAKKNTEVARAALLELKLARERGFLISRDAVDRGVQDAARFVMHEIMGLEAEAEEIHGIAIGEGVAGVASYLKRWARQTCEKIADKLDGEVLIDDGSSDDEELSD